MSPNPPTRSPNDAPPGGILLLEEYGALGVAIASALTKFAPLHAIRVAHSFTEAEAAAAEMHPELFVLDLDPPPQGEIAFLNKLQAQFPQARVLVIAAGTSRELRAERGPMGAIQFLEKPFNLPEFGAAVQALLGPWAGPASTSFRGTLRDLHVVDIVQLKCLALSTSIVRVETPQGQTGEIYFRHGRISHATAGELGGTAALEEIVSWPEGKMSEAELPPDVPKTIDAPWPVVLLQAIRKTAEKRRRSSLGAAAAREPAGRKSGKKILVIDDTEMILIFVADVLATADQSFQIITAATGREGLKLAAALRPDLVLLDYCLTDMNGGDVCRELLADEATARIPVLMMSGHLLELASTEERFGNVVATLAKPFLSGALISATEKVLAAGPLPKSPPLPPVSKAQTSAPETPASLPPKPSPNGHGRPQIPPPSPPVVTTPRSEDLPLPPATAPAPVVAQPETIVSAAAPANRRTQVRVTLSLEVISVQLTPLFRMEALKLRPVSSIVAMKVRDPGTLSSMPLEAGFRVDFLALDAVGRIETMRLIPTLQSPELAASEKFFASGGWSLRPANAHQNLQLTALETAPMHVQLTAQFKLLSFELSPELEIGALVLKSRGTMVRVSAAAGHAGAIFELQEVQLTAAGQLETLYVTATE